MESLEALVAHIQGLSGSPEELAHLHSLLKQADGDSLRSHAAALVPFLAHLSPGAHSLGYLYLLYAASLRPSPNPNPTFEPIAISLLPQILFSKLFPL
jgi:COP9 signalosome complex subunit 3